MDDGGDDTVVHAWGPSLLRAGDAVEVFGLQSEGGSKLNGRTGVVTKYAEDTGRFEVRFSEEKKASVRQENLRKLDCSPGDFSIGDAVEVHGLTSGTGKELNGKNGTVTSYVEGSDPVRLEVRFPNGPPKYDYKLVKLQPDNLRRINRNPLAGKKKAASGGYPKAKPQPGPIFNHVNVEMAAEEAAAAPGLLAAGDDVEVSGLESDAGRQLNGRRGVVLRVDDERGRAEVLFEELDGKVQSLRLKNLSRVGRFATGDLVEVVGLSSDSGRDLNGQKGTITQYQADKGRYEVQLLPRRLVSLKQENLALATPASGGYV